MYFGQKKILYGTVLSILILLGNSGVTTIPQKASFALLNDPSMLQLPIDIASESLFSQEQIEKSLQLSKIADSENTDDASKEENSDIWEDDEKKNTDQSAHHDESQEKSEKNNPE